MILAIKLEFWFYCMRQNCIIIIKGLEHTKYRPASEQPVQKHTPAAPGPLLRTQCSDPVYELPDPAGEAEPP